MHIAESGYSVTSSIMMISAPVPMLLSCRSNRRLELCAEMVAGIAATHTNAVDREARFPTEVFAAARAEGLLSLLVPVQLGGEGASVSDIADICYALGRACGSSAMVFAMHQIMVAMLAFRVRCATSCPHRS
jgi:alkylation response protein AidB-like acyl-CoA dehydrogenase